MSSLLNYLLSGGAVRRKVGDLSHGVLWTIRLVGGRSDVPEMRLLDNLDLLGRVALDVGANAGIWSVNLSRRVGLGGRVIAYEALPHYGRALSVVIKLLRIRNVQIRNVAVGSAEQMIGLRWRSDSGRGLGGLTHIERRQQSTSNVIEVQMICLDSDLERLGVNPSEVAFVKIDVEGAELEVLRGAKALLSEGRPAVYLEAEPKWLSRLGHSVEEVFSELSSHGYLAYLVTSSGIVPTSQEAYVEQYAAERNYNNVLFMHPGS